MHFFVKFKEKNCVYSQFYESYPQSYILSTPVRTNKISTCFEPKIF